MRSILRRIHACCIQTYEQKWLVQLRYQRKGFRHYLNQMFVSERNNPWARREAGRESIRLINFLLLVDDAFAGQKSCNCIQK